MPHAFRQCGVDKLAQRRLGFCPCEINTKTDSGSLREQWLEDRQSMEAYGQHRHLYPAPMFS